MRTLRSLRFFADRSGWTSCFAVLALIAQGMACAFILPPAAAGQPLRRIQSGFERDVNRYHWLFSGDIAERFGKWNVQASNRFTSDAFILFNDRLSIRDENALRWQVARPLGRVLEGRVFGSSDWFSQGRVLDQTVQSALRYAASPALWIEPSAGFAWNQRPGAPIADDVDPVRLDAGPAYGIQMLFAPAATADTRVRLAAEGDWQVINPRRAGRFRLNGVAQRSFGGTRLSAEAALTSLRRDSYQAVSFLNRGDQADRFSETVEATFSDTARAAVRLESPLPGNFSLTGSVDAAAVSRRVRTFRAPEETLFFDTDFGRQALGLDVGLRWANEATEAVLTLRSEGESESRLLANRETLPPVQAAQKSNLLQQADFDQGLLGLGLMLRRRFGPSTAYFNGFTSIIRHDTPDNNPDDRDERFASGDAGWSLRLSRYLQADLGVLATYYHTVFLKAERSGENNVQRSLRFRPSARWTPSAATNVRLGGEVRATYTVADFAVEQGPPRDQSAREFRLEGDLDQRLGTGLRLLANGGRSDLHLGRLIWSRFAEIPYDTLRTYYGSVRLRAGRRVVAELGYRFYIRSDYDRALTVRFNRYDEGGNPILLGGDPLVGSITRSGRKSIVQGGPITTIRYPVGRGSTLHVDGWLNIQHVRYRLYGTLPAESAESIRDSARRGARTVTPNVTLGVLWNF